MPYMFATGSEILPSCRRAWLKLNIIVCPFSLSFLSFLPELEDEESEPSALEVVVVVSSYLLFLFFLFVRTARRGCVRTASPIPVHMSSVLVLAPVLVKNDASPFNKTNPAVVIEIYRFQHRPQLLEALVAFLLEAIEPIITRAGPVNEQATDRTDMYQKVQKEGKGGRAQIKTTIQSQQRAMFQYLYDRHTDTHTTTYGDTR